MSNWLYLGVAVTEPPEGSVGFIYKITRLDTGRMYIGKKLLQFRRTKQVKGVKKKLMVESDWKTYHGQNQTLKDEVVELGSDAFKREILKFCFQKSECNYEEARVMLDERVLFQELYYNQWIQLKATKKHISQAMKKNIF